MTTSIVDHSPPCLFQAIHTYMHQQKTNQDNPLTNREKSEQTTPSSDMQHHDSPYTDFENLCLKFQNDARLDQDTAITLKKLTMAIKHRDTRPGTTSNMRIICPECKMHYWSKHSILSKKHSTNCLKAQEIHSILREIQEQDDLQPKNNIPLEDFLEKQDIIELAESQESTDKGKNVIELLTSQESDWQENEIEDNFITIHKELPEELQNKLITFQGYKEPNKLTLFFKNGVYGDIVNFIGSIIQCYDQIPNRGKTHLFSIGTLRREGHIRMTYKVIRILISGFDLNKKTRPKIHISLSNLSIQL